MPGDESARASRKLPAPADPFKPRETFGGIGLFIPEQVAAATTLSMTAKVCYGHLVRRAGKKARCWPSYRDVAKCLGVGERQAMRALKELVAVNLIRPIPRKDVSGRQTSNEYEFVWGLILQGEGDTYDTLPPVTSVMGRVTDMTPTGVTDMTPLEVIKRNHHQSKNKEGSFGQFESTVQDASEPELGRTLSHKSKPDDDHFKGSEYASAKDELKAIYEASAGVPIRAADLDAIESQLSCTGVTWERFVAEARGHDWKRITNPTGFLKKLAKNFRARTQPASAAVTAAEAAEKNYRCPICHSTVRGEGVVLGGNGKPAPCACACPEYVARLRERGVLESEATP